MRSRHPQLEGVFIHRPLIPESLGLVENMQARLSNVPTFSPTSLPHVTILNSDRTDGLRYGALQQVVHPLPPAAEDAVTVGVRDLEVLTSHERTTFAIMLDDHELLVSEHKLFAGRENDIRPRDKIRNPFVPHVTLGTVDFAHTTEEARALAGRLPKVLRFAGIMCIPEIIAPDKPDWHPSTPEVEVKTVSTRPFPPGFLTSLRKSKEQG